jgi:hypothetical protein
MVPGRARLIVGLAATFLALLAVQGCGREEENQPLLHNKGTYPGPKEPPLSDQQLEQLRQRAENQNY